MTTKKPKVVVIGGGTGSFTVLTGLKKLDCDLKALVNMVDDGGSTGQLRDEYGVLPPGDIRQCLVALSEAPVSLRNLFNFRFPAGSSLGGHSFGNLFLSSVEMMTDNFLEAVKMASEVLNIKGEVLPVTTEKCQLIMDYKGEQIIGQKAVDNKKLQIGSRPSLYLKPKAKIAPEASKAISKADLIVISPGNLYTSLIPTLLVDGVPDALKNSKAAVVYICNLVNKPENTAMFKVSDYVAELERFAGKDTIDFVIYNIDPPSEELLVKYARNDEHPVIIDEQTLRQAKYIAKPAKLLSYIGAKQDKNDFLLERSLLRHNSESLANEVQKILEEQII